MFVSILVPAFNEQGNILPAAERIAGTLAAQNIRGNAPHGVTLRVRARVARHARNRGLSYALSTGLGDDRRGDRVSGWLLSVSRRLSR